MWKVEHRTAAERYGLRYPSDLTDAEWALIGPLIPAAKRGGRRRSVDVRAVLNGIFYVLSTGCQWNAMPSDLPPRSTNFYFKRWEEDGTLDDIHDALHEQVREQAGRPAGASLGIIDSQTAKGGQKGGPRLTRLAKPALGPAEGWTRGIRARKRKAASAISSSTR
jgi:transposase